MKLYVIYSLELKISNRENSNTDLNHKTDHDCTYNTNINSGHTSLKTRFSSRNPVFC